MFSGVARNFVKGVLDSGMGAGGVCAPSRVKRGRFWVSTLQPALFICIVKFIALAV